MISNPKILNSLIRDIRNKITKETTECDEILESLRNEVPTYVEILNNLHQDIEALRQFQNLGLEIYERSDQLPIESEPINNSDYLKDIKLLYRRISQKTHPDKTNDKELNDCFTKAKTAYETQNLSELINIYITVFGNLEIDIALESLQQEFNREKERYENLQKSVGFTIRKFIKENKLIAARELFIKHIFHEIKQAENLYSQLSKQNSEL